MWLDKKSEINILYDKKKKHRNENEEWICKYKLKTKNIYILKHKFMEDFHEKKNEITLNNQVFIIKKRKL